MIWRFEKMDCPPLCPVLKRNIFLTTVIDLPRSARVRLNAKAMPGFIRPGGKRVRRGGYGLVAGGSAIGPGRVETLRYNRSYSTGKTITI